MDNLPSVIVDEPDYHLFPNITHVKKRAFLTAFARFGALTLAGQMSGVDDRNHYHWLRTDPVYARCYEEAKEIAANYWEDEVTRRAFHGIDKPIFYKGEKVATVREFSDMLAMFALNGARPHKYKVKPEEVHPVQPITVQILNYYGEKQDNPDPAQLQREELSTPVSGGDGLGAKTGGVSVAPQSWKRQNGSEFHN